MWKRLAGWLMGKEDELHERLTRTVILLGGVVTLAGLLEMVLLRGITGMLIIVMLTVCLLVGSVCLLRLNSVNMIWQLSCWGWLLLFFFFR